MQLLLAVISVAFLVAASPTPEPFLGPAIAAGAAAAIKIDMESWQPCHTYTASPRYFSKVRYGTAEATICHHNATMHDGLPVKIPVFTAEDAKVAKCMLGLHHTTGFRCISVLHSSCDFHAYTGNGGKINNLRNLSFGKGRDDNLKIAYDELRAGELAIDTLVGQTVGSMTTGVAIFFWDPNGNHRLPSPNKIGIDFHSNQRGQHLTC